MYLNTDGFTVEGGSAHSEIRYKSLKDIGEIKVCRKGCIEAAVCKEASEMRIHFHILHEIFTSAVTGISIGVKKLFLGRLFADELEEHPGGHEDGFSITLIDNLV